MKTKKTSKNCKPSKESSSAVTGGLTTLSDSVASVYVRSVLEKARVPQQ